MLFQPKWKGGSLFGGSLSKGGAWNNWKMNAGGRNFYRPNPYASYAPVAVQAPTGGGYQFNEQLNVAPFSLPSPLNPYASSPAAGHHSTSANDGWSVPVNYNTNQPITQQTSYDTSSGYNAQQYSQPLIQAQGGGGGGVKQPILDPYSIKGGNVVVNPNRLSSTTSTTKK